MESKILYQEVYNRQENLRLLNLPEASYEENEDTKEIVYRFPERELKIEDVKRLEFRRIHRIGKNLADTLDLSSRDFYAFKTENWSSMQRGK